MAEMAERAVRQELETEDPVHTLSVAGSVALGCCHPWTSPSSSNGCTELGQSGASRSWVGMFRHGWTCLARGRGEAGRCPQVAGRDPQQGGIPTSPENSFSKELCGCLGVHATVLGEVNPQGK